MSLTQLGNAGQAMPSSSAELAAVGVVTVPAFDGTLLTRGHFR